MYSKSIFCFLILGLLTLAKINGEVDNLTCQCNDFYSYLESQGKAYEYYFKCKMNKKGQVTELDLIDIYNLDINNIANIPNSINMYMYITYIHIHIDNLLGEQIYFIPNLNSTKTDIIQIGKQFIIPDFGSCYEYKSSNSNDNNRDTDGKKCYPKISNNFNNIEVKNNTSNDFHIIRVQDAYNLEYDDKWDLINDVLTNNVDSITYDDVLIDADSIHNVIFNYKFNNVTDKFVLTINFMNVARATSENDFINFLVSDYIFFAIDTTATYINNKLINYDGTFYIYYLINILILLILNLGLLYYIIYIIQFTNTYKVFDIIKQIRVLILNFLKLIILIKYLLHIETF